MEYVILINIGSFLLGVGVGWIFKSLTSDSKFFNLKNFIGTIISLGWLIAVISQIFVPTFIIGWELHALMGAVVGALFDSSLLNRFKK